MNGFRAFVVCAACAAATAASPGKGDAAKGKQVFQASCAVCHSADSAQKKIGPGLKGLFKRAKMTDGKKPTEANVRARIDEGGNGMPQYKDTLSDQEKNDLIAYLRTI